MSSILGLVEVCPFDLSKELHGVVVCKLGSKVMQVRVMGSSSGMAPVIFGKVFI